MHQFNLAALEVGFGEGDYDKREDEGRCSIVITALGHMKETDSVVLEVVPVTLSEWVALHQNLPYGVGLDEDPAEPGI